MFAKLKNGIIEYAPKNYIDDNGRLITNFDKNINLMKANGFKEIIEEKPTLTENEYLVIEGYSETATNIIIKYVAKKIENKPTNIRETIDKIQENDKGQDELINICLCATDEMYMMIEPLLPINSFNVKGGSKMVDMYVAMVIRGLKTIDEVPSRYREEVRKILEALEK